MSDLRDGTVRRGTVRILWRTEAKWELPVDMCSRLARVNESREAARLAFAREFMKTDRHGQHTIICY